ncbi:MULTISPECIES: methylmalonyl-CoA mutase subunit beta [unclassified Bosea (in: a-proteobacteria)]|uniref:methylmalonyl-CoA mutase subunit beta n=1 Tax=unclassified Bosea (in: a-proteobacteria) TaxID=2653178 RepID=UPI000F76364F|nr:MULTISPECIES: methylmalonyl-CoA mutase subunit beta [unclassified Bosea (in: a-proteobacteria)]AZO78354.1 methylmalonyl-CoA mutase [Bosea sp. Tri-49]RXT20467.1 methylmalonyl-CoA mutase [Bosea sp. Tri-39]RXT37339.1 methylmalonyl-CoA mutase [Bosea sp. Tri-54]
MTSTVLADLSFMDAFPTPGEAQWRAAVDKVLKGADFEKKLVGRTSDGIRIEPLYEAAAGSSSRPLRAQAGRWHVTARVDHPDEAEAAKLALADLEGGADSLSLSFAGALAARGFGLRATTIEALDTALDGVMLDLVRLRLDTAPGGRKHALLLADLAEKRGHAPSSLQIDFGMEPIGVLASSGALAVQLPELGKRIAETIANLKGRGFTGPFVAADGRIWHEAGATEGQELGAVLATAVTYLRLLEAEGVPLAQARDAISFTLVVDADEFVSVAKLRAARLLWDRVQRACGLDPEPVFIHAETAWRSLTRRDPWVNLLRGTIATFSAGVGGADSISVQPFTAALGLPDGFARRIARNTQLILLEEANLWRVADPAAGAGGFEQLTQALCEQGWRKFQDLEAESVDGLTGIVAALANGHVQTGLGRERATRAKAIATRREPITGTSEFPNLSEASVSVLAPPPAALAEPAGNSVITVEALPSVRLAEPFEALRASADIAEAAGERPKAFLATLGPIAGFAARAGFARNLFEAGGMAAPSGDGFAKTGATDLDALVAAFRASGAKLACLCGSDEAYASEAIPAAAALTAAGATIWLAGRPGEQEAALREAGVTNFVFAGCDAVAVLQDALAIAISPVSTNKG